MKIEDLRSAYADLCLKAPKKDAAIPAMADRHKDTKMDINQRLPFVSWSFCDNLFRFVQVNVIQTKKTKDKLRMESHRG